MLINYLHQAYRTIAPLRQEAIFQFAVLQALHSLKQKTNEYLLFQAKTTATRIAILRYQTLLQTRPGRKDGRPMLGHGVWERRLAKVLLGECGKRGMRPLAKMLLSKL